ncbi:MAG TPA: N-6 DNA methylase [Candidatus Saccharimonadales bacterium]|jgi:type I restriction-modification system DNA methylase subunit|nr:N-6 DNA methylase [Candidatus Saccharimonadales bacterium]
MANQFDVVIQLTSGYLPEADRAVRLQEFSRELGWRPTDRLELPALRGIASAQLLVEHGLENSAVISFLQTPKQYSTLSSDERQSLLSVSYNNLVDWHVAIDGSGIDFVYVRTRIPTSMARHAFSRENYESLRSEIFEQVVGLRPSPNIPALDDALIRTISLWKRSLSAELSDRVTNAQLARLFNALVFVRALEDQRRRLTANSEDLLLKGWRRENAPANLRTLLSAAVQEIVGSDIPAFLFHEADLGVFDQLDRDTVHTLLCDFYENRFAPYRYDFAVISKHALSRIYEQYVSLLRQDESAQLSLLPQLPSEFSDKSHGAVYTPQFIARFFARFLREHIPPYQFKRLRTIDPACGSGIFLRTLLEFQCDPTNDALRPELIEAAFLNTVGLDRDANAVAATQLSLSLLYLVLTNRLPKSLSVFQKDFLDSTPPPLGAEAPFDAVLINPPFVSLDVQDTATRARLAALLGSEGSGRIDLYLAFLKDAIERLHAGGFALFVLPHSFLLSKSAQGIRNWILEHCWIHCLADLSAIRVFEDTSVYVILLIVQRKGENLPDVKATIIKCQDQVGHALQDAIEGKRVEGKFYSIYDVDQSTFRSEGWLVLAPTEAAINRRFATLPALEEFLRVPQGLVSGADDVFILDNNVVPGDEPSLFIPLLRDREMQPYTVPKRTSQSVFFPYFEGVKVTEKMLQNDFPKTWSYLLKHRSRLEERKALTRYRKAWWEPMWPREPDTLLRPKLVVPHLVIVPRFALDGKGRYAVSHSPFLIARVLSDEEQILKLMLAILNSTPGFWHIQTHSHVYRHGYTMLESKTLARTPVPDINSWSSSDKKRLLGLVDKRLKAEGQQREAVSAEIDLFVSDAYGLTANERKALGLEEVVI